MNKPKMILFDYGHTLVYESGFDGVRGTEALLRYAVRNKNQLSAEEISQFSDHLFEILGRLVRDYGIEIHQHQFQHLMYEYLQIEFYLSPSEMEEIFWDHAAPGEPMPNIEHLLNFLKQENIRSGVISNISFSGEALAGRINRLLPNNSFELILASSEVVFRKPHPFIFELALKKAGLQACDVWYCGDNPRLDILGAAGAGIFPVWYKSEKNCYYRKKNDDIIPGCEHLQIGDWLELIDFLEKLK